MASSSGPPLGGLATRSSSSAAINILVRQCRGCCGCSCNCGCRDCSCRTRVDIVDPNREEYGGEGTLLGVGAQAVTQPTSYASTSSANSVKESSDAPAPMATTTDAPQSFDPIRALHGRSCVPDLTDEMMNRFLIEPDDACPWEHYLEKSITSDAMDGEPGFFGPAELDGSMLNHAPFSSGEHSMLSSFMSSLSIHAPSAGTSDVIRGVGDVFGPRGPMRLN